MNEQKKNELGNIYGSRISKNGNWLNLLIVTHVGGQEVRITCPVRILKEIDEDTGKKPHAVIEMACDVNGNKYPVGKALIAGLPIYEDKKPTEAQAKAEDSDLPF